MKSSSLCSQRVRPRLTAARGMKDGHLFARKGIIWFPEALPS